MKSSQLTLLLTLPLMNGITRAALVVLLSAAGASVAAAQVAWGGDILRQAPEWYASAEARAVADNVIQYQSPQGGWPKNMDLSVWPPSAGAPGHATIDNNATTRPMRFLALTAQAGGEARYRVAFERGIDYLLASQYPNGGWPQFPPLREGYYSRITYNDNAMVNVLTLLRDIGTGQAPYSFVEAPRQSKAAAAVARGTELILRTQVKQEGTLTAWCAQHHENTLDPAWARNYEPPSLSGSESVGIVRFLMEIERPTPEIIAAIEGAVAWLQSVKIHGLRVAATTSEAGERDHRAVADPTAPLLWARFYELRTNRPIFIGRDSVIRYDFNEIERERRAGYAYLGSWPARLLDEDYPRWRTRHRPQ